MGYLWNLERSNWAKSHHTVNPSPVPPPLVPG